MAIDVAPVVAVEELAVDWLEWLDDVESDVDEWWLFVVVAVLLSCESFSGDASVLVACRLLLPFVVRLVIFGDDMVGLDC